MGGLTAQAAHAALGVTQFAVGGDALTATSALEGSLSFKTPSGWHRFNRSGSRAPVFTVKADAGCSMRVSVSVRGVATQESVADQVRRAVGQAPLGQGARPGGRWGTDGPTLSGGEGEEAVSGVYGIAPIRVQERRYGQVRVTALLRGCAPTTPAAQTLLSPTGPFVLQVNHLLAHARPSLRVARVRGQAPRLVGTPSARYSLFRSATGRSVNVGVLFRLDRALDGRHLGLLAAPEVHSGETVPDELFEGSTPGRIGRPAAHCYIAEAAQLRQRSVVDATRWHVGIYSSAAVVSNIRPIQLKRAGSDDWELPAARRLGC